MSDFLEYIYMVFTRIWDFLDSSFQFINDTIDFLYTGVTWLGTLIVSLPVPVQASFILLLVLAVICLFLNR